MIILNKSTNITNQILLRTNTSSEVSEDCFALVELSDELLKDVSEISRLIKVKFPEEKDYSISYFDKSCIIVRMAHIKNIEVLETCFQEGEDFCFIESLTNLENYRKLFDQNIEVMRIIIGKRSFCWQFIASFDNLIRDTVPLPISDITI